MAEQSEEEKRIEKKRKRNAKYRRKWNRDLSVKVKKYNISFEEFLSILSKSAGKCDICGEPLSQKTYTVDHNHKNNKVRGLLCRKCNSALGLFNDSPAILDQAKAYLTERGYFGSAKKIRKKRAFGKKRTQEFKEYLEKWHPKILEIPFLEKIKKQ